ncbi:probable serine/threonine-protein kinase At1g54610 [Cannabis sativa]|uniref:Protein kinase domain-containing protein n=1 Tax=Cannabis sativa TaxID=3483 RepID=A0A7J6GIQ5_CANSA|nr:probable serine/threonine-protein kinase At1g54610 [Cannabis sativa]KAF4382728.1 hypothetical protein F8388_015556 [Cannabis sativa]KAF4386458.1 hypothetical protein G4B88_006714 [Cannabis sativa]
MGCICSKTSAVKDSRESPRKILSSSNNQYSELKVSRHNSSKREEGVWTKERLDGGDVKVMLIDKKISGSVRIYEDQVEMKKTEKTEVAVFNHPGFGKVPKATQGEQVAAGWPTWLSMAAPEAISGWLPRRADTFEKLNKIGQGTYSSVFKARDVINNKFVALKKVRFDNLDIESVKFMAREILLLRRLDHPNIIKLEGLITSRTSCSLYLIFEYMEHDLTGLASRPGIKFTESQVKCYMHQLLSGLDHCHSHGVLHRDIKGSNLLIDNNGILKIADFGLASFYDPHNSVSLTSRVVTLWYRPPELLLGASHYGVAVDLWSTGCILGELYSGRPILPGKTEVEQLHKIFKLCGSPSEEYWRNLHLRHATVMKPPQPYRRCVAETFKELPAPAVQLMETLLSIDPSNRRTASFALKSEFFTTSPLACDPSTLPKYPPSKEIDAKFLEEEVRRQGARGHKIDLERRGQREAQAIHAANAYAGRKQDHSNSKSHSEVFNHRREESYSGYLIDPTKQSRVVRDSRKDSRDDHNRRTSSHSGPLIPGYGLTRAGRDRNDPSNVSTRANLSKLSGLVAARTTASSEDQQEKAGSSHSQETSDGGRLRLSNNGADSTKKQDRKHHSLRVAHSRRQVDDGKACDKESSLHGHNPKSNKIYVSGPLLVSSNNMDQMLKEHDRRIQEYARRTRIDKSRPGSQGLAYPVSASKQVAG